jgi:CHAD domain-containing protein
MTDPYDDVVDPVDRRVHRILARIADIARDEEVRERALELMVSMPPVDDWSAERLLALRQRILQWRNRAVVR